MSLLSCFRLDLNANFVIGNEVLTLDDLAELSRPFLRFDEVELDYNSGSHLIANKCEIFASQLQNVARLSEANSICVWATVNQNIRMRRDRGHFLDHSQLLNHLRDVLLPICGYCRQYKFLFPLPWQTERQNKGSVLIKSILKMQQIIGCPNVIIEFGGNYKQFPLKCISNWLLRNQNTNNGGNEFANQDQQERILEIEACYSDIVGMLNHFKKVLFNWL